MGMIIGAAIGFICGALTGINHMKENAINAGVAEYTVDKTTGEVTFQYVQPNH